MKLVVFALLFALCTVSVYATNESNSTNQSSIPVLLPNTVLSTPSDVVVLVASEQESDEQITIVNEPNLPIEEELSEPEALEVIGESARDSPTRDPYVVNAPIPYCTSRACATQILDSMTLSHNAFGGREVVQIERDPNYPCSLGAGGTIVCKPISPEGSASLSNSNDISEGIPVVDYRRPVYEGYNRQLDREIVSGVRIASYERQMVDPTVEQRIYVNASQTGVIVVGFASNVFIVTDFTYGTCSNCSISATQVTLENVHTSDASQVLAWRFSGDGTDSSGYANTAVFEGATFVNNTFADGFAFNDANKVYAADANSIDLNNMTLSFWVRFNSLTADQTLFNRYTSTNGYLCTFVDATNTGIQCYTRNSTAGGVVWIQTGGSGSTQNPDYVVNKWYHIVLSYNKSSGNLSIYQDGSLKQSTIATNHSMSSTQSFKFGADYFEAFNGSVDEVLLYNKTLTASQVSTLYSSGLYITNPSYGNYTSMIDLGESTTVDSVTWVSSGNVTVSARSGEYAKPVVGTTGLIGYWPLNQSALCKDATGRYNGTATNVTCGDDAGPFSLENATLFDSDSDVITLPLTSMLSGDWAVQVWVRSDGSCIDGQNIFVKDWDYRIFVDGSCNIDLISRNSTGTDAAMGNICSLSDGRWHAIAYTYNNTAKTAYGYCDGVLKSSVTQQGTYTTTTNYTIGRGTTAKTFRGSIAHVSLWNRSLSALDIVTWNSWTSDLVSGGDPGLTGRYIGYSAILRTNDTLTTPVLNSVSFGTDATCAMNDGVYNATFVNGAAASGGAGVFDGVDDRVDTDLNVSSVLNNGSFSISLWVKSDADSGQRAFISADSLSSDRFYLRQSDVSSNQVVVGFSSWNTVVASAGALSGWTHYVIIVNGTSGLFYRNGLNIANTTGITKNYPTKYLRFGANGDTLAETLDGSMDGIAVYNRAITHSEVAQLYANTSVSSGLIFGMDFDSCDGSTSFTYDPNGNLQSDGTFTYEYDNFNRLVTVWSGAANTTKVSDYFYDEQGIRVRKREYSGGAITTRTYYPEDDFVRTYNSSNQTTEEAYYRIGGTLVAQSKANNFTFIHPNHLGTPDMVTNSSGGITETTKLDPYGNDIVGGNSRYVFTGHERDTETGLDYMKARHYSADLALFVQPDQLYENIYDPQTLNRYQYARNNPIRNTDPTGKYTCGEGCTAHTFLPGLTLYSGALPDEGESAYSWNAQNMRVSNPQSTLTTDLAIAFSTRNVASFASAPVPVTANIVTNGQRGVASQQAILNEMGLVSNTKSFQAVDPVTGTLRGTIPDAITSTALMEIKDVQRVSNTIQLRTQAEVAKAQGLTPTLITGTYTKVSSAVKDSWTVVRSEVLGPKAPPKI